ncbi:hypothetical protein BX589_10217 [Paraburkholderia fungorum]|jgi:hypothetical protein|nr:hypothetical protein BX589_10217 [Paraburkholderia fungorum]
MPPVCGVSTTDAFEARVRTQGLALTESANQGVEVGEVLAVSGPEDAWWRRIDKVRSGLTDSR